MVYVIIFALLLVAELVYFKIADKFIGDNCPCFIIAEIGINHNGSVTLAKKMIDIAVLRANPEAVKENMIKKFQHSKLHLVDEILLVDKECREFVTKGSELRGRKNDLSKQIGIFFKNKEIEKANAAKAEIAQLDLKILKADVLQVEDVRAFVEDLAATTKALLTALPELFIYVTGFTNKCFLPSIYISLKSSIKVSKAYL